MSWELSPRTVSLSFCAAVLWSLELALERWGLQLLWPLLAGDRRQRCLAVQTGRGGWGGGRLRQRAGWQGRPRSCASLRAENITLQTPGL